jgi:hypothetical protein
LEDKKDSIKVALHKNWDPMWKITKKQRLGVWLKW